MAESFAVTAGPSQCSVFLLPCRICLLQTGTLSVYDKMDFNIIKAIRCFTGLVVLKNDPFTKKICSKCCTFLRDAISFRIKARESYGILQEHYHSKTNKNDSKDNFKVPKPVKSNKNASSNNSLAKHSQVTSQNSDSESEVEPVSVKKEPKKLKITAGNVKSEPSEDEVKNKIQCKKCFEFVSKSKFNDHIADHNATFRPDGKVECNICGKEMKRNSFKSHLAIKHNMQECPKYVCEQCGRIFYHPASYYGHLVSHKTEFPFKCNQCDYKGPTESYLKAHMRRHSKDPPHQCNECQARFTNKCNLTRHLLRHKGKTVKCNECDKYFYTKSEVDKHYEVEHLGIMKHVCNICNKPFGYRTAMMKHSLAVHKRPTTGTGRTPSYLQNKFNDQ